MPTNMKINILVEEGWRRVRNCSSSLCPTEDEDKDDDKKNIKDLDDDRITKEHDDDPA